MTPSTDKILQQAATHLDNLRGHRFDVLSITKPISVGAAANLAKVISKLSPILGNLIEYNICEYLNDQPEFQEYGRWIRQDPGFPDTIFVGEVDPVPGIEIKAWFPLATEITARFKDSQCAFEKDQTWVALLAWLPSHILYGTPTIIDITLLHGGSIAKARDDHYHRPPDYVILEPEDTSDRTSNLQQTNTNGYKYQGSTETLNSAVQTVKEWGPQGTLYSTSPDYQAKLKDLISAYPYRTDTNYAKIDRIQHDGIETFKTQVLSQEIFSRSIKDWARLLSRGSEQAVSTALQSDLGIREIDSGEIIK